MTTQALATPLVFFLHALVSGVFGAPLLGMVYQDGNQTDDVIIEHRAKYDLPPRTAVISPTDRWTILATCLDPSDPRYDEQFERELKRNGDTYGLVIFETVLYQRQTLPLLEDAMKLVAPGGDLMIYSFKDRQKTVVRKPKGEPNAPQAN